MVRLTDDNSPTTPRLTIKDLVQPSFKTFNVPKPEMSIWLMTLPPGRQAFPWWTYNGKIDGDINALNQDWNIPSAQGLFDCLFLAGLSRFAGAQSFTIFPGCIKTSAWGTLRPIDRDVFTKGQGCIYQLFGAYEKGLAINWVPFWQPQSLVRCPPFGSLWRLFSSNTGDETTRCITMFGLSNPRKLPEVTNLLIGKDDQRSEKLISLVDWYGVYSSPIEPRAGTCAVIYTKHPEVIAKLGQLQTHFMAHLSQAQEELLKETSPRMALRIMSRQVSQ